MKRLSFTLEKDGSIKVHGFLVGFPDEVSIGEATPVPYAERDNKKSWLATRRTRCAAPSTRAGGQMLASRSFTIDHLLA